jgi:ferric-dicitrate binding protein FerR (iron transport regulator)
MKKSERIGTLMFRYVRKEITPSEERELNAWRSLSPENERFFQEKTNTENILKNLSQQLNTGEPGFLNQKVRFPEFFRRSLDNKQ